MKVKAYRLICFFVALSLAILFLFSVDNLYVGALLTTFFVSFVWFCSDAGNTYLALFLVAFFTFLLGRPIAKEILKNDTLYYSMTIPQDADNYSYVVMLISLISIIIGYCVTKKVSKHEESYCVDIGEKTQAIINVERVMRILSIVSAGCLIAVNTESAIYVQTVGYLSSYLGRKSVLPGVITQIADMMPMIFAFYMATIPSKKNAKGPIILYIIAMTLNLVAGRRYEAVSAVLLLVLYATYRNGMGGEKWLKKSHVFFLIAMVPIAMIFLILMESWRAGGSGKPLSVKLFAEFLNSVGSSSQIISYERMFHENLSSRNVLFSFGNVWRSLNGNAIARFLGMSTVYESQTVENALYGHSISAYIMYKINPSRMLAGGGIGSCYMAELMCDFSYAGLILGNVLIGILLQKLSRLRNNRLVSNFLTVFLATALFRMPRDSFDYFFYQLLGIKSIALFLFVWIVYHQQSRQPGAFE